MAHDAGFDEKAFDEFHLYTLGRKTTLPNNSTKQIELFDQARAGAGEAPAGVSPAPAPFRWSRGRYEDRDFPAGGERKVDAYLEFRNDKASGLGVPLPAGRIRVSRLDAADNSLEFIGEDVIDHTPRDETVRVQLGSAFDVVGERKQVDFTSDITRALDGGRNRGRGAQPQGRRPWKCRCARSCSAGATGRSCPAPSRTRRKTRSTILFPVKVRRRTATRR